MRSLAFYLSPVFFLILSVNAFGQTRESTTAVTIGDTTPCSCNLATTVTSLTNATSCTSSNGSISVNVSGGSGSFAFSWTDQSGAQISTSKDIQNLLPGFYFLKVNDTNNPSCSGQSFFEITADISISFSVTANSNCILPTGSVSVAVSGGSGNFAYNWTFPDGTKVSQQNLSGLKGGQYLLKVTDLDRGCTVSKSVTVKNPTNLVLQTLAIQNNTSCLSPNGAISVWISGGSGFYKYYWYDTQNGMYVSYAKDLSLARAGEYSLYVVDQISGCVVYQFFDLLDETNAPDYAYAVTPNTNCATPFNGAIDLQPGGSPGPYTFSWTDGSTTVSTTEDLTGLAPGRYGFSITDNTTGCSTVVGVNDDDAVVIDDQSFPNLDVIVDGTTDNTNCSQPDGTIQISVQSENTYTFYWTGPNGFTSSEQDLTGLAAGTYVFHALASCASGVNLPPVISSTPISQRVNTDVVANLLDGIVTDPDGNLDERSIQVIEAPTSTVPFTLASDGTLTVRYEGSGFKGRDRLKIRACDLLGACAEGYIVIDIHSGDIVVYNAVAPHSSGDNKFMRILNLPEVSNTVSIYNRWGDKVYEVANYDSYFPGKRFEGLALSGNELPSGTYFYKIEFADGRKPLTGYLALKQ